MCNILKTADRRAKRMKIWDSGTTVHICRVPLMPGALSLVWVIRCTLQNFQFYDFQNSTPPKIFIRFASDSFCHLPKIKNFIALKIWHPKMCNILKMAETDENVGVAVLRTVVCRVLMSDSFEFS